MALSATRTDRGRITLAAPSDRVFRALTDPHDILRWRPPAGMRGVVHEFDAREGGGFRMSFLYDDNDTPGKSSANADMFEGRFLRLAPNELVIEEIRFQSDDPAFAEPMTIETRLTATEAGTQVDIACRNVPEAISEADHLAGIASSLENLARLLA